MSKITIANNDANGDKKSDEIPVGTIFTGAVGDSDSLFVTCSNPMENGVPLIVDLKLPEKIWASRQVVYNYHEVNITVTIDK